MLIGKQTWEFRNKPVIIGAATVVGPEEGEGPLASDFDFTYDNLEIDEKTWEKAERKLLEHAASLSLVHANISKDQLSFFIGGDLMNQIISASFAARHLMVPYIGIFGACSTSMESLTVTDIERVACFNGSEVPVRLVVMANNRVYTSFCAVDGCVRNFSQ